MYNVSTAYKNYIANNLERNYKVRLTVGTDVIDSDDIFSYSLEINQPSDKFTIGNAISQILKIEIKNQEKPFYTNQLYLQIGMLVNGEYEYVPIGYFNVDKSEKKDYRTTITAYDNMYKLEGLYVCKLGNTKTIKDILTDITSKTGIKIAADNYKNYTISDEIVGYSYREVIAMMAGLNGGNAYIGRDGKIKFVYLSNKTTKWAINDYYLFDGNSFKEQSYTIDKVICYKDKDTSWSNGDLGTTPMTIEYENPFMTQAIAKDIYDKLANINYQAFNMETMSYLALDVGDWITYTAQDNTVYSLCIQHYKFNGGIKQTLESKTDGNKDNFNASGSLTQKVNRTITDLLAAKKAIIDKANISDLVAGKILFNTMSGGSATIQDILTQFIGGDDGQFLHLTSGNVVIDEAVIKDLIASHIKVSDLVAGAINTSKFNIISEDGGISINGSTQQFKDKDGKVRLQIGKDAEGNFTFILVGADGKTSIINEDGITKDAIPSKVIINDMVSDNAAIHGSKLDIDTVISEINNNGTETFKSSVVKLDDTGQTLDVAFKELTTTVNNLDVENKNLVSFNTDNWVQGDINASTGVEGTSEYYIKTKDYIQVELGDYTITKYDTNDFDLYVLVYNESKQFTRGFGLINDMTYTTSFSKGFIRLMIRNKLTDPRVKITVENLKEHKFKVEDGKQSSSFSYNPVDIGSLTQTLQTSVKINQGQISQLIKDTTIEESGKTKTLKDAYNETKLTVSETVQTIARVETKVNDIQVGARNLLLNTLNFDGTVWEVNDASINPSKWNDFTVATIIKNWGSYRQRPKYKIGQKYTFSFYAKAQNKNVELKFYNTNSTLSDHDAGGNNIRVTSNCSTVWTRYSITFTAKAEIGLIRVEPTNITSVGGYLYVCGYMLEEGTMMTSYSQNPDDIKADINSIESKVSQVQIRTTDEALSVQVQKNQNRMFNIRYIRDYCNGSTSYANSSHWLEIQALSNFGTNLALNKTATSNVTLTNGSYITDGDYKTSTHYASTNAGTTIPYVQIDLGQIYNNVDEIKVWHYYADGRTYHKTKTMVSSDGVNWITLFDSAVSGEYIETQYGHSIKVNGTSFNSSLTTINENGLNVKEGAISITNKAGTKVLEGDVNGNLKYVGIMEQRNPNTGYLATALKNNGLGIYDVKRKDDLVGGITSTEMPSSKRGCITLFADKGNILTIGYKSEGPEEDFSSGTFPSVMVIDDTAQEEQGYVTSFYKSMAFFNDPAFKRSVNIEGLTHHYSWSNYFDYSGITYYGNDHNVSLGDIYVTSSSNSLCIMANGNYGSVKIGTQRNGGYYTTLDVNNGGCTMYGNLRIEGDLGVTGGKNRVIKTKHGDITMNAYEMGQAYFGTTGKIFLNSEGEATIYLDDIFKEVSNTVCEYDVDLRVYETGDMTREEVKDLWARAMSST